MAKVFLYKDYEGYIVERNLVASSDVMGTDESPLKLYDDQGHYLLVTDGGIAHNVVVESSSGEGDDPLDEFGNDSVSIVVQSGGIIEKLAANSVCVTTLESGALLRGASICRKARVEVRGEAQEVTSLSGMMNLYGTAENVVICQERDTYFDILEGKYVSSLYRGTLTVADDGATLSSVTVDGGWLKINAGAVSEASVLSGGTVMISGGTLTGADFASGSTLLTEWGNSGLELSDITLHSGSFARLYAGTKLGGVIGVGASIELMETIDAATATADFLLGECSADATALIDDWSRCQFGNATITIDASQEIGAYALAKNAGDFGLETAVKLQDGTVLGVLSIDSLLENGATAYSLDIDKAGELSFSVYLNNFVRIALDKEESRSILVHALSETLTVYAASPDEMSAFGRRGDESEWKSSEIGRVAISDGAQLLNLKSDGLVDVVMLDACGKWSGGYVARNENTLEYYGLSGMNRYDDLLWTNGDATLLILSEENDAFFADDIFTPSADGVAEAASRLRNLTEIRAGAGDDLIDMTMTHAEDANQKLVIRGGEGNDTLWGGNDGARFFGDDGDDALVGGCGDDILAGGAGDDTLQGLTGNNIYAFGENFGNDTVILNENEEFRLWFDDGVSIDSIDYSDGDAILKAGSDTLTVKNIVAGGLEDRVLCGPADGACFAGYNYGSLQALGAFLADSTTQTFCRK